MNSGIIKNLREYSYPRGIFICGSIALVVLGGLIFSAFYLTSVYFAPAGGSTEPKVVDIISGMDSYRIANLLADEKLIRNSRAFYTLAWLSGSSRQLKAGRYKLNSQLSSFEILRKLVRGEVITQRLVIPEGFTIAQIAQLWEEKGLGKVSDFKQAARDKNLLERYQIEAPNLEGYLFPDTYEIAYNTTAQMFVERMLQQFNHKFSQFSKEAADVGLSVHEAVTLASIIEKETKVASERSIISAVFHNRLRRGWKLEADPTVLYALGNPKRNLTYDDLKINSPYNTYLYKGLPPGPICNPGLDSIIAAIRPDQTPYMYFVAIGDGTHYFSKTLNEHRQAVKRARRYSNLQSLRIRPKARSIVSK